MKTKRKTEAQTTPFHGPNLHPHPHPEHNDDGGTQHEEDETTPYQEAQQDEEVEEEEEEEEEEEVEEGEGRGGGGGRGRGRGRGEQSERPKLDDGFYEIEAIRRRRVRKGQLQYLIKWRGWPENANTWEPLENLQACSDVIDAFEDRLRSKRNRSSRKRKRKSGGSAQTLPKKKQQRSGASNVRGVHFRINDEHLLSTHVNTLGHADIEGREEDNDSDPKLIELRGSNEGNANKFKIQFQEVKALEGDCPMNGHSKVERVEMDQSSRRTGARRRKSGSVKRVESPEFPGNDSGLNNKFDGAINMSAITEIIKPISYSASISNDAQDVSVTLWP
ncbi:Chromo domain protein LHP1 [Vitis vinifera]|uniref:Chromo domain protein LHP1 n=1 Tax=Vitis vinifera TaxID=29760 RepID=A0A438GE79_VITVI|nr:Chromo domain protein LHP1 [Vitis vinifera]